MLRPKLAPDDPLPTPFIVVVDTREQHPFDFEGLVADAKDHRRPLLVRTERRGLASGDYSLAGFESHIAVERKSTADLFSTLGQGRERFERELFRLNQMEYAAVVIEAGWVEILSDPPAHSQLLPKTIHRSVIAWQQRYPRIHWWPCGNRRLAEVTTFRILERFWKEQQHGKEETQE